MMTQSPTFADLLRDWRGRRRYSQLELASEAGISQRHLSFMESGRSRPSRGMILTLADRLGLPLRERNRLLLASGFAPVFAERPLDAPDMRIIRQAVERILTAQQPFPALALDRSWNMIAANGAVARLIGDVAPHLLAPPVNVLRLSLDAQGLAPRILNLTEWRRHLIERARRQIAMTGNTELAALLETIDLPAAARHRPASPSHDPASVVAVTLKLASPQGALTFLSTTTVFGTPGDVTLDELMIETFLPADAFTDAWLQTDRPGQGG